MEFYEEIKEEISLCTMLGNVHINFIYEEATEGGTLLDIHPYEPGKWEANIIPVPRKDGKVRMCVDYRDLNKASLKDNFSLPQIDTLVDNTTGYSLFSFMDGFSGYNQIKMYPEDMRKTIFVTLWGTFCYKVMSFALKNAGATYQKATLKLNPAKYTFRARSGKLLGFIASEKRIEIDPDKVKVEAASYVSKFLKKKIICWYGRIERIISDNALNLKNGIIAEILAELKLDEVECIQSRYDQLNLIEEKRQKAIHHGQMYQKRMMRAYNKKVHPREFHDGDLVLKKIIPLKKDFREKWMPNWEGPYIVKKDFFGGALILSEMDGKNLPNPVKKR
ncbi:uncharacterized protein [Gossypium hirsutum]|uniref:Reverse transcriptase domain-containing protein n=1 Tax=Gossypium hirsutum TaxID=3635 RepID=A0ABM3AD55_GOSHI|nr:uncharacterized protein LOC121219167 [Gossypium hirsutum]